MGAASMILIFEKEEAYYSLGHRYMLSPSGLKTKILYRAGGAWRSKQSKHTHNNEGGKEKERLGPWEISEQAKAK